MALLLGFLVLAGGCSAFTSPRIEVGQPVLTDRSGEAARLEIPLRLEHDNEEPLELLEFEYRFRLSDGTTYRGRRSAEATLAANGSRLIILPAVVRYDELSFDPAELPEDLRWSLSGKLLYVSPGRLAETLLDLGVYRPTANFSGRGAIGRDDL